MSQPYSKRLFAGVIAAGSGATDLWTVPAGKVHVIRDIDGWTESSVGDTWYIGLSGNRVITLPAPTGSAAALWRGRQVFNAGETIQLFQSHGASHLAVSGYELDVP